MAKQMQNVLCARSFIYIYLSEQLSDLFQDLSHSTLQYGGNPVSCAMALSVLDVIEREQLQTRAAKTGRYILDQLDAMKERHSLIGNVRWVWGIIAAKQRLKPQ